MTSYILSACKLYLTNYTGLSKSCWQGIIVCIINSILCGMFYFLSIYFVNTLHLSIATSGIIISSYGIGAIFGGFIGGKLSDDFSPKQVQTLALFAQAIGYFTLIKLKSPIFLVLNTFFLGLSSYLFITANYLFVLSQTSSEENMRLRSINLLSMGSNLGLGLSAILIGFFAKYGFENLFYITGSLFFLTFCSAIRIKDSSTSPKNVENASPSANNPTINSFIIRVVLICVFLTGLAIAQLSSTYSLYLQSAFPAMGLKSVSILFTLNSLLIVLFEAPFVGLFNQQNKILMTGIGSLLIGSGLLLLSFSTIFLAAILSCIIYTIGEMIFFSMAQLICYQKSLRTKKGKSMGLYRMVYAASQIMGPATGSLIYSQLGGNAVWYFCGVVGMICITICIYAPSIYLAGKISSHPH